MADVGYVVRIKPTSYLWQCPDEIDVLVFASMTNCSVEEYVPRSTIAVVIEVVRRPYSSHHLCSSQLLSRPQDEWPLTLDKPSPTSYSLSKLNTFLTYM